MKKIISLVIAILMLGLAATASWAGTGEIAITQVLGSSNTAATGPVQYLVDNNPGTAWCSANDTTGPLWTELQLSETVIVDGLQIYGHYQGNLKIEYWQNNGWHSFLSARSLDGANSSYGWNLMDLSYDRIATSRLRLSLSADQPGKLGGIGEVKVLGRRAADVLQRLEPLSVGDSTRSQYGYSAGYLFDHDTYTDWRVYGGSPDAQSVGDLGESCSIGRIKIYTSPNTGSNSYRGQFKIQYQSTNNNWCDVPGVSIDLAKMVKGWQSFDISGISASKFRMVFSGSQVMGGIKEVEFWGYRRTVSGSSYFYSNGVPVALNTNNSANYLLNLSDVGSGTYNLHLTGNGNEATSDLTWELNGYSMGALTVSSVKDGTVFYHIPIDMRRLQPGANYIRINGSGLTLTDCRIEKAIGYTLEGSNSCLTDRWLLTTAAAGESLIDLGGTYHLDQMVLQYLGSRPDVQVAVFQNGHWIQLAGASANPTDSLGGQLIYSGVGTASQIRISSDGGSPSNGLCELLLYGSGINEGAPRIQITSPLDGQVFTLSQWGQGKFCATLDNPDVVLKLNGQITYFSGTSITLPLPQLGTPQGDQLIEAVVTDSQGRSGSAKITISVSTPPDFTINLPEGITYTTQPKITISGQVIIPTSQVTINGTAVAIKNNKFSIDYPLQEGLNLLTIKLVPSPGSTQVNTLVRKVVRNSRAPYLQIRYPADGQVVNAAQITVSGEVSSIVPVTVTVNGKAATVNGGNFYSSPVALSEKSNLITVVATDQNNHSTKATLTVQRDSTAPVLSNVLPADGAYLNTPTIKVSGTVSDASAVSVLVNGMAASVSNNQFTIDIPGNEGANTLNIQATDSAGNVASPVTRRVFIDTNNPEGFTPTANPSGWTNNNKPAITFGTTDSESGIDHYEIGLDGGTTSGRIISPYTFTTAIPDGEHKVQVKAVDRAGNSTVGEVKVYIDTTAPAAPSGFEVISGIGRVIINWTDPQGEIVGYRITRTPEFAGGSCIDLARSSVTSVLAQCIDRDVTDGASYTYSLQALDHGGNYSPKTSSITVTVGTANQGIDKNGGTVKFDECTITFPKGAITDNATMVLKEGDTMPENTYAVGVSSFYSFSLQNQAGETISAKFDEPVTLQINYRDMNLPQGYNEEDLGVYWYNDETGNWEKLERAWVDSNSKTLTAVLSHFSEYQVMASQFVSPSLDSYYNLGVSPYQSYFKDNQEVVGPTSGQLSVTATDLTLPGRNGFDLVLQRIYDGGANQQAVVTSSNVFTDKYSSVSLENYYGIDTFGTGWTLNIPWVETNDKGSFIHLPDGTAYKFEDHVFEYKKGRYFKLYVQTHREKHHWYSHHKTVIDAYTLTLNDGTVYQLDSNGKPTQMVDPSGEYTITYSYDGKKLTKITDSLGREILLSYNTVEFDLKGKHFAKEAITKISYGNGERVIQYHYSGTNGRLDYVIDPMNRKTQYGYDDNASIPMNDNKTKTYYYSLLNSITYPTGATSKYTYKLYNQKYRGMSSKGYEDKSRGWSYLVATHVLEGKRTTYDYTVDNTIVFIFNNNTICFVPGSPYFISCVITEDKKVTTQTFKQVVKKGSSYDLLNPSSGQVYEETLIVSNQIQNNGNLFETVNYSYGQLPLTFATNEEHLRCGSQHTYYVSHNYDSWGNPIKNFDSSRNLEESWSYHNQGLRFKNLVETYKKKNINPLTLSVSTQTTSYQYNDTTGRPTQLTVNDGTRDIVTTFEYDGYGNLIKKIQWNTSDSLETDYQYDATFHAYPRVKALMNIKEADGNTLGNIVTGYAYDFYGNKTWEVQPTRYYDNTSVAAFDPDANDISLYGTRYDYDKLNRVTKVILPVDEDSSTHPFRQYIFDDAKNTCDFYNENGQRIQFKFDGLGRLYQIDKLTDGSKFLSTKYSYDTLGRIDTVTDMNTHVTRYDYDSLNRVTKVTYPDSNHVTLQYDDATNTVVITDENGVKVAEERSDWANRLIEAKQYSAYHGETNPYIWNFNYDSFDNKVSQADPNYSVTKQLFDALNHLTEVNFPLANVVVNGTLKSENPTIVYEYDKLGNKTLETDANGNKIRYTYDQLGRNTKITVYKNDGGAVISETKTYYDALGNKIRSIDGNQKEWKYSYSVRGYLLSESDPEGNTTRYRYDPLGNKIAVIDPRNTGEAPVTWYTISGNTVTIHDPRTDKSFTTWYLYDNLNRLYRTVLPGDTPPSDPYAASISDSYPHTETAYDNVGNKLSVRDANGVMTAYTYTSRNWVDTVKQNGKLKYSYSYDKKGNQTDITDALNHTTHMDYDSLNRVRQVVRPTALTKQEFTYDGVGNRLSVANGRGDTTYYTYNSLNWLTGVRDPLKNYTQYLYDLNGNQVQAIAANGLVTRNRYDELNRLIEQTDSLNQPTTYSYDGAGNRTGMRDRRGSAWSYQYYGNNLLKRVDAANGTESYYAEYSYDEAGNRKSVKDSGNTVNYNFRDGVYRADPLNRLTSIDRNFDGASYRTEYQYNSAKPALLAAIQYPEAVSMLQYNYDEENRLSEVAGFTKPQGITYNDDDTLQKIDYANGVITNFTYDAAGRLQDLTANGVGTGVMEQHYTYDDQTNNIKTINDGKTTKTFTYDANNQLTRSVTPGKFMESDPTPGTYGIKKGDYLGAKMMDFTPVLTAMMGLDYNSSSIGIDFGAVAPGIKKIQIIPDGKFRAHRITQRSLDLYTSGDNSTYTVLSRSNWSFVADSEGVITIILKESVATRYLKIHVKFDERDSGFTAKNKATFLNDLAKMLRIYQEASSRTEEFHYDAAGNRKDQIITLIRSNTYSSSYYTNSDRLKTDGKFAFVYDEAGNLVKKGNTFKISGDTVTYTATSGDGVEYWQYTYDLLNRLTKVSKNGTVISDYEYSPDGLREVKRGSSGTIHYVFEGTEPIFEKRISDGRIRSYVYALGKHLARVDGVIWDQAAKVYYYHTDNVGSVKAVTDQGGKVVFNADYFAFGTKYTSNGDFDETHGFTGKEYDCDTGLYYYNARWYDSELGRFISEDPVGDPNNPNLYSYCANNSLSNIDPTGLLGTLTLAASNPVGESIGAAVGAAGARVGGSVTGGSSSSSTPKVPDFKAPDAREQYDNYWKGLSKNFYNDPEVLQEALKVMWMGVDQWGNDAMPTKGWGSKGNHDDKGSKNMVKAIQAALGIANPTGYYGNTTKTLLSILNASGIKLGQGTRVGQAMLNKLMDLNQKIIDGYHDGFVQLNLSNVKNGVIPFMDQFAARSLLLLDKRANDLGIKYSFIEIFRTRKTQEFLRSQFDQGLMPWTNKCAMPGTSPHEAGIAFDVNGALLAGNFNKFKNIATSVGFTWEGAGDRNHFGMYQYEYNRVEEVQRASNVYNNLNW